MDKMLIAALPMYDWPERRAEVDAEWASIRTELRASGIAAPDELARRNADMPAVAGGIRDARGVLIAADPATLPPDEFDLSTLWRHPALIFGQTCWGPLSLGLSDHVVVIGQPDYSAVPGGDGALYSSALVMRRSDAGFAGDLEPPDDGAALLPVAMMRTRRLAFNSPDSMSGYLGLRRDLEQAGESVLMFDRLVETGAHRASIRAVADGLADIAAIDARSWQLAKHHDAAAAELVVVGWTARSSGLPFICAASLARDSGLANDRFYRLI